MNRTLKRLGNCARCQKDHENIVFKEFTHKPENFKYTHFSICPNTNEPILLWED